jgi:sorbitol-specific phosphotransferase system component IIC
MGRLHPDVRVPATLVVMMWSLFNVVGDAELRRLWGNMPDPRFIPYLLVHVLGIFVWLAAMLVGGIFLPVRFRRSTEA